MNLGSDSFNRPDQTGWGDASDGQLWSANGTITPAISSNRGQISGSNGFPSMILGSKTSAPINVLCSVAQINNIFDGIGPCFRWQDVNNMYFCALYAGTLLFAKMQGGGFTELASAAFTATLGAYSWVRAIMVGDHLQARAWASGSSEPGTFLLDTNDSTFSSGKFGISTNTFSSGSDADEVNSFLATDNQSDNNAIADIFWTQQQPARVIQA